MDLGALRRSLKVGPRLTRAWQDMEQVTIGAIEGFCIGGGVALAVALDFRVMADNAHMRSTPPWRLRKRSRGSRRCRWR
jgi:enoyl-CoA hydratase/carnithine racemase